MLEMLSRFWKRKPKQDVPEIKEVDLEYMTDTSAAMLQGAPLKYHWILGLSAAFLIIILVWADHAVLDVVTTGEGKVIPSSNLQVVQNLEGGIVKDIRVKEGDVVERDQILMVIDDTRFSSSLKENEVQVYALEAKIARLSAEAEGTELKFPTTLETNYPSFVESERDLYENRLDELNKKRSILKDDVEQARQQLLEVTRKKEQLTRSLQLVQKELNLTRPLVQSGAVSEVELLRLERTVNDLAGDLQATEIAVPRLEAALSQSQKKVDDLDLTFRSQAGTDLNAARSDFKRLQETLLAATDRYVRTRVRSPVRGTINKINVKTLGAVIQPGQDIMEIVPLNDTLLIEAFIHPKDIGFLRPGLDAIVKISAYDFSIYGGLKAKVEHVSADTITNEKGDSFYTIRVRTTDKNFLYDNVTGEKLEMYPGMSATVDVLTGHKTVLDYWLKPLIKAKKSALRER